MKTFLVTGGAGFIGSNFIRHLLQKYEDYEVVNLDKLTYAGNLHNLRDVEKNPRYEFVQGDICDRELVDRLMQRIDMVVNFAAESHVDRSIMEAEDFMRSNTMGVFTLLDVARRHTVDRILQVSTDEVYGSLAPGEPSWSEDAPMAPRNPYSVSKAAGDMMARAFGLTYGLPVLITRSANNIGPFQYPEKRVPLFISNAIEDLPLPVYGKGLAVRDHLYVTDHCEAIDVVLHKGTPGEAYNVGGDNDADGETVAKKILKFVEKPESLFEYVKDRPAHDMRYALDTSKIRALGWKPQYDFESALRQTVSWYLEHQDWWRNIKEGSDFKAYYERQYLRR